MSEKCITLPDYNTQSNPNGIVPVLKVFMPQRMSDELREVLASGYIAEGPRVELFEKQLADWLCVDDVLALNSGTSALWLALRLANVGPGDEVISSPMTCIAANAQIVLAGAHIRWADIDPETGNIDPADIQQKITPRTRAILMVHWGGAPCDLEEINRIAAENGLKVIEDACHAFGSEYNEHKLGRDSDFVCYSFQAVKMMTTGDGGALVCRSSEDSRRGRLLRWYGLDRKLDHRMERRHAFFEQDILEPGTKIHMNDLTAAIGIEQMNYLEGNIEAHRSHAARYDEAFGDLRHVRPMRRKPNRRSNDWLYTLRIENQKAFAGTMNQAGFAVSPVHVRNDRYTMFKEYQCDLPGVEQFDREHICIPVGWWLGGEVVDRVIEAVLAYEAELT